GRPDHVVPRRRQEGRTAHQVVRRPRGLDRRQRRRRWRLRVQQLRRWMPAALLLSACLPLSSAWGEPGTALEENNAGSLLRWFTDSGKVSVRSLMGDYAFPVLKAGLLSVHYNNEQVPIPAIAAAPGTQEAIDAITTASRPISGNAFQDFVKVRNEFTGELTEG